ncbi:MAG: hypothetical protein L3J44_02035 [Campylobacteraceae bacterium]|nr:hypothetical protein [Campylobacteraceae bacterium]
MRRLYKIIILFILIFLVGIYFAIKSINDNFSDEVNTEVISINPTFLIYATLLNTINSF